MKHYYVFDTLPCTVKCDRGASRLEFCGEIFSEEVTTNENVFLLATKEHLILQELTILQTQGEHGF